MPQPNAKGNDHIVKLFTGMLYALLASATDARIAKHHPTLALVSSEIVQLSQIHKSLERHGGRTRYVFLRQCLYRAVILCGYLYAYQDRHVLLGYWALENILQYLKSRMHSPGENEDGHTSHSSQHMSRKFLVLGYWLQAMLIYYLNDTGALLVLSAKAFAVLIPVFIFLAWCLKQIETPFEGPGVKGDIFAIPKVIILILYHGFEWIHMKFEVPIARFQGQSLPALSSRIAQWQRQWYHSRRVPEYPYSKIPSTGHIRLLKIQRGMSLFGIIRADIVVVAINDAPGYEALSYCWGTIPASEEILINGKLFPLRKSAYDLLYSRRSLWRRKLVWCDAICIDQNDFAEKSCQVAQMTEIYRKAESVVVWPGGDWTAHLAGPFILRTAHAYHKLKDEDFSELLYRNKFRPHWQAMVSLFKNEYFNRVWIVQEISVNPNVHIYHGETSIPWKKYQIVLRECHQEHRRAFLVEPNWSQSSWTSSENLAIEHATILTALRHDENDNSNQLKIQLDFANLWFACRKFHATDPRDKVYALVGISVDGQHDLLRPDYNKVENDVYTNAAIFAMRYGKNPILALAMAGIGWNRQAHTLPSWVPDLKATPPHIPLTLPKNHAVFCASRDTSLHVLFSTCDQQLHLRGVIFDTILDTISAEARSTTSDAREYTGENCQSQSWEENHGVLSFPKEFKLKGSLRFIRNFHRDAHDTVLRNKALWTDDAALEDNFRMTLIGAYRLHKHYTPFAPEEVVSSYPQWLTLTTILSNESITNVEVVEQLGEDTVRRLSNPSARETRLEQADASAMADICHSRRFCITQRGLMALVPPGARIGDKVAVFHGAQVPCVLRRVDAKQSGNMYRLVGEGYFHGVMDGEALKFGQEEIITLV